MKDNKITKSENDIRVAKDAFQKLRSTEKQKI